MKALPRDFWLLCLSTLVFVLSFNLVLPELNSFLESIGESENKWAVLVPWTITAMLLRPLSGKMSDVVGRKFVIYIGIAVTIVASVFYPFALVLSTFFLLRLFHGICVGYQPTGASALAADLIPQNIRGEAMGLFSISISLGFGIGQFLGNPIKSWLGLDGVFYAMAFFGVLSLLLMLPVKETKPRKVNFKWSDIIPLPQEIIAPEVLVTAVIMMLITICTGFYFLLIPEISPKLGVENKGLFFLTHMLSGLVVRYLAGKLSDRIGRRKALILGVSIFTLATLLMIGVESKALFFFSGFVYGVGTAIISPTIMAWTTDLADPEKKGRGLSTMWMGLELGVMIGSILGMVIYQNKAENIPWIFGVAATILAIIVIYLLTFGRKVPDRFHQKEPIKEIDPIV